MTWIVLSLISALLLGCYDIAKTMSARKNAVPPVLLVSVSIGALFWVPSLTWSWVSPETQPISLLALEPISWLQHGQVIAKSALVASSWTFSLFALKHLPLSVAAPIRSTSPLWTILLATVWLGERPSLLQWLGITIVLASFWMFSVVGRREGIHFAGNRWVACMMLATLTGAISSIYDKHLLQTCGFPVTTLQAWFSIYLVPATMPCFVWWWVRERGVNPFQMRRAVLWISPLLLAADLVYFRAVADEQALISVISTLRRCSVIVAFIYGIRALGESQFVPKAWCVTGILIGAIILATTG